ncbi:hypothetical protein ACHAWF_011392 [Thalassiosira exigua]
MPTAVAERSISPPRGRRTAASDRGGTGRGGGGGGGRGDERFQESVRECRLDDEEGGEVDDGDGARPGLRPSGRARRRRATDDANDLDDLVRRLERDDPNLTELALSKRSLVDADVLPLFDALGRNARCRVLDLRRNRTGLEGCSSLASALLDNATLVSIDVSGNEIGDEGIADLAKALPYHAALRTLVVEDVDAGDAGAARLAEALRKGSELERLDLSSNRVGDEGSSALFRALGTPRAKLRVLRLRFNAASDEGATELASALLDNESLVEVDLGHNRIANKGATDLLKVASVNDTLEVLELGGNQGIDEGLIEEVRRALEEEGGSSGSESESESDGRSGSFSESDSGSEREEARPGGARGDDGAAAAAGDAQPTGGEAMLADMPDEDNAALAKRQLIQSIMKDGSLSMVEKNKKIQDVMAGRVELPKVEKEEEPRPTTPPSREGGGGDEAVNDAPTGGEAMLADMPDEDDGALAKRQLIQSIMKDGSLTTVERNKKIQDVMAGRVELPKAEKKKSRQRPERTAPEAASRGEAAGPGREEEARPATAGDAQPTGGEAMLADMPDEDDAALAKRQLIQSIMKDSSLNTKEKNKKIQDVMAGKVALPKVKRKAQKAEEKPQPASPRRGGENAGASGASWGKAELEEVSMDGSESGGSSDDDDDAGAPGAEAMLRDMPDEDDVARAKRAAIQEVARDASLGPAERTKKMQDIMAGKAKLPPPPPRKSESKPSSPSRKSKSKPPPRIDEERRPPRREEETASANAGAGASRGESRGDKRTAKRADGQDGRKPAPPQAVREAAAKSGDVKTAPRQKSPKKQSTATKGDKRSAMRRQQSYDGGARAALAQEWKERMTAVHPRSHDDPLDVLLAHRYRLSLRTPPRQSYFRVVAVVFFSRAVDGVLRRERFHVAGTNDEPHSPAGAICAERAALMQLRFVPDLEEVTKVVIVTDDADAISPGMLCREFMASHDRVPWDVPVVLGRSVCRKCGFTVSGKACGDEDGRFAEAEGAARDASAGLFATCAEGHAAARNKKYPTPHDFVGTVTTLRDLFPHPSLYARLTSREALKFGENYMERINPPSSKNKLDDADVPASFANGNRRFDDPTAFSYRQEKFDLTMLTDIMEGDEEGTEGGLEKSDRSGSDLSNRGQNSSMASATNRRSPTVKSSMTKSLKTTIDFMRQVREEPRHELDVSGLSGVSDLPGTLEHLTARTLRLSSRLKPSQRREKLMRLATEVTALESHQKHAHPIRYGAAVLFSDDTVAIASQKVALEYGCTLDAVGQLASVIDRKAIQVEEDSPPCRPLLLVQCDQFGIAHAPFAQGRAYLTERGYGDCKVLVHQRRSSPATIGEGEARKVDRDVDDGKAENGEDVDLKLLEVEANDLAPAPPDIFGGFATKNHSQGGLQIQF